MSYIIGVTIRTGTV